MAADPPAAAQRDHVFISYRRDDARGASGRLYDWLCIAFGRERVFRDVHSIGVGEWLEAIDGALARSAACVAVIGPRWADDKNRTRLHDKNDIVRRELLIALRSKEHGLKVIPTLVEDAAIPEESALPVALRPLLKWNVRKVTEDGWERDIRQLIKEIADASALPVGEDLDTLMHAATAAQQRVAQLEQTSQLQASQIEALHHTVDGLRSKLAGASGAQRPALAEALAALARGDTLAAEDAFEREGSAQAQAAAHAFRNVANLALTHDVTKAETFYRRALALEPEDAETNRLLGQALMLVGNLAGARVAFSESLRIAAVQEDPRGEMAALGGLGDVRVAQGDSPGALAEYRKVLQIAEALVVRDPTNTQWQCDLSVCHERMGNVLMMQGDAPGALAAYCKALRTREAQTVCDAAAPQRQRELSVNHEKIGDALTAQGDGPGALAEYRKVLQTREALAVHDPANTQWQRDLSVIHEKIGDVLMAQGDGPMVMAEYRKALQIHEALAVRDPANTQWQRDLLSGHGKIGDMLVVQGDGPGALAEYRKALQIAKALAVHDPTNTQWQRDLQLGHGRIGDMLVVQGDGPGALAEYRKALQIAKALAVHDPANTQWQCDLLSGHGKIGDMLVVQGDGPGALAEYRKALQIAEALAVRDPANTQWRHDLLVSHGKLGNVLMAQGDNLGALVAYRETLQIAQALVSRDLTNTRWQRDLSVSHEKIGDVLLVQGDGPGALAEYRKALQIREALAVRDPANTQLQRDVSVIHGKRGNALTAQGDNPGALTAYRKALQIAEAPAVRDPANAQWQTDVAACCAKLDMLNREAPSEGRCPLLLRGQQRLVKLIAHVRLHLRITWFKQLLKKLRSSHHRKNHSRPGDRGP
jgi:tetratricopeptide (TPR) repeat protein